MCGIIAYSGYENAGNIIIKGLEAVEYRGYDSAGMTVFTENKTVTIKTNGRVFQLKHKADNIKENTFCGIGHTRWATHGKPSEKNAHPHSTEMVSVVHNGIIENYGKLKEELIKKGYVFVSETDTEVVANLIEYFYDMGLDFKAAVQKAVERVEGSYALHPALRDAYDLRVFLDIDAQRQSERILKRNGPEMHKRFINEWIPLENAYFDGLNVRQTANLAFDC